jgi:hypothetical protein
VEFHDCKEDVAVRGRTKRIRTTEITEMSPKMVNIVSLETCRSLRTPKSQSARPPQEIEKKLSMPYAVARDDAGMIWHKIGMLLQSKNPQPHPKRISPPMHKLRAVDIGMLEASPVATPTAINAGTRSDMPMAEV